MLPDVKIVADHYIPNPYPEPIDDGTWEGEGGYVAKPNHQLYVMEMPKPYSFATPYLNRKETIMVMHPLTYAEYEYALNKVKDFFE